MGNLEQIVKEINKKLGKNKLRFGDEIEHLKIRRITTGSLALDIETGGGFPQGRSVEIYGQPSSGKTYIAMKSMAANMVLYPEAKFAWIGFEPLDIDWAKTCGLDKNRMYYFEPDYLEQGLDVAYDLIASGELFQIVIDSWGAMCPKEELDGEMEKTTMALRARLGNKFMRKINSLHPQFEDGPEVNLGNTSLVIINQVYDKMDMYSPEETPGGKGLKFISAIRIKMRTSDRREDKKGGIIQQESTCVTIKNKTYVPKKKATFWFNLEDTDKGKAGSIWRMGEVLTYGTMAGIIKKSGAWFSLPESFGVEKPFHGAEALVDWLTEQDEEVNKKLENLVTQTVLRGGDGFGFDRQEDSGDA